MIPFIVKPSADKKNPGYVIECRQQRTTHVDKFIINDGAAFETEKEADAYCDRLNKLFGNKGE